MVDEQLSHAGYPSEHVGALDAAVSLPFEAEVALPDEALKSSDRHLIQPALHILVSFRGVRPESASHPHNRAFGEHKVDPRHRSEEEHVRAVWCEPRRSERYQQDTAGPDGRSHLPEHVFGIAKVFEAVLRHGDVEAPDAVLWKGARELEPISGHVQALRQRPRLSETVFVRIDPAMETVCHPKPQPTSSTARPAIRRSNSGNSRRSKSRAFSSFQVGWPPGRSGPAGSREKASRTRSLKLPPACAWTAVNGVIVFSRCRRASRPATSMPGYAPLREEARQQRVVRRTHARDATRPLLLDKRNMRRSGFCRVRVPLVHRRPKRQEDFPPTSGPSGSSTLVRVVGDQTSMTGCRVMVRVSNSSQLQWAWVELNYRPHAYQACALTT